MAENDLLVMSFEPGPIGLRLDAGGRVLSVKPGSQANDRGILVGWVLKTIEGSLYSTMSLTDKINGSSSYQLSFDPGLSTSRASGSSPSPQLGASGEDNPDQRARASFAPPPRASASLVPSADKLPRPGKYFGECAQVGNNGRIQTSVAHAATKFTLTLESDRFQITREAKLEGHYPKSKSGQMLRNRSYNGRLVETGNGIKGVFDIRWPVFSQFSHDTKVMEKKKKDVDIYLSIDPNDGSIRVRAKCLIFSGNDFCDDTLTVGFRDLVLVRM